VFHLRQRPFFTIDPATLKIRSQRLIPNIVVSGMRESTGHLYSAGTFSKNCRVERTVSLFELGPGFEQMTIFESNNVNSLELRDLEITKDGSILLVGTVSTFLPTSLTVDVPSIEQLKSYKVSDLWNESFWEKTEQQGNAFALVVSRSGTVLGDRIFPDLINRSISSVSARPNNQFIAVGGAFGQRGWVASVRVRDQSQ
jgi:hypothetical protein